VLLYDNVHDYEYFTPGDYPFRRCGSCGLVFLHPAPTRDELPALYPSTYHNFEAPARGVAKWLLDRYYAKQAASCLRLTPPGGSVLEVGCAGGELLARIARTGRRVRGVEISKPACELAWERGLDVFHGTLEEFEADEPVDLVVMSHVIEHVVDPVATIRRVHALLAPGGVLALETPNVGALDARLWKSQWGLVHYPRHLFLFDRATVRRLLEAGGLQVERVRSEINSCGWALSVQSWLRRRGWDRNREPRSSYYPVLLVALLPLNVLDLATGGTAFMSVTARRPADGT
jgi:2-polyprenyl-3-methyl-5-hydroxy-6-metoxy-1,4-benzoquinol methylase